MVLRSRRFFVVVVVFRMYLLLILPSVYAVKYICMKMSFVLCDVNLNESEQLMARENVLVVGFIKHTIYALVENCHLKMLL